MNSRSIIDSIAVYSMFFSRVEHSSSYTERKISLYRKELYGAIDIEIKEGYAVITEEYYDTNKAFVVTIPLIDKARMLFGVLGSILGEDIKENGIETHLQPNMNIETVKKVSYIQEDLFK